MREQAIERLEKEFKTACKTQKGRIVLPYVYNALKDFCEQNEEFARAVVQNSKTLVECADEITKGIGGYASDIDIYKKAVDFYFPTATIKFTMEIDLGDDGFSNSKPSEESGLKLSLDSLLDF